MTTRQRRRKPREETSAGGVVFRRGDDGPLFLLIRDSYRNWGFPKGHLEEGEDPDRAALREVSEETGLGVLRLTSPIETIDWQFRFRGRLIHKVCHFYLMETPQRRTRPQRVHSATMASMSPSAASAIAKVDIDAPHTTLPGFKIPFGSSVRLSARMRSSATGSL